MSYSKEAHELLNETLEVLKTKVAYPYAHLLGMLLPNVSLEDAKRIAKSVEEMESQK